MKKPSLDEKILLGNITHLEDPTIRLTSARYGMGIEYFTFHSGHDLCGIEVYIVTFRNRI